MNLRNGTTAAIKPTTGFPTFGSLGDACVRTTVLRCPRVQIAPNPPSDLTRRTKAVLGSQYFVTAMAAKPESKTFSQ